MASMSALAPLTLSDDLRPVGREDELERVTAFLGAVSEGPAALTVTGAAGIGKTACWRYAVASCRAAGFEVLATRPSEEERFVATSGLVDLFGESCSPGHEWLTTDPLGRGRAVLSVVRRLAAEAPVVIAVDDAPWLDSVSSRALAYALRRLQDEPVGLLVTTRTGTDQARPASLAQNLAPERVDTIELGPLDVAALRGVLATRIQSISRPSMARIHQLSGGNPLHALELASCLTGSSGIPAAMIETSLPPSLTGAIEGHLDSLPSNLTRLLDVLSVAGPAPLGLLAAVLGGPLVQTEVPAAEECGLVVVDGDLRARFGHPLVGTVVYNRLSVLTRHSLHARLSHLAEDEEVRARHLALSTVGADVRVAQSLDDAAARSRARGATDLAAEFAAHSLRLTDPEDPLARCRRSLDLISHLAAAGEVRQAMEVADRLAQTLPPGPDRARVRLRQFFVDRADYGTGARLLEQALTDAGGDTRLWAEVADLFGWVQGMFCGDLTAGTRLAEQAIRVATEADCTEVRGIAEAHLTHMRTLTGACGPTDMAGLLGGGIGSTTPPVGAGPAAWLGKQWLWAGDLERSRAQTLAVLGSDERAGNELERPYRLYDLALVACAAGDLDEAEQFARLGLTGAQDAENPDAEGWLDYPLALLHAMRGRTMSARRHADRLLDSTTRPSGLPARARGLRVLGLLALAEADYATAAEQLSEAARLLERWGVRNPGVVPVLPDALEALATVGDLAGAERLAERLATEAELVRTRWSAAHAARARGVCLLGRGSASEAAIWLAACHSDFVRLGHRFDAARAVLLLGRAQLRAGQRGAAQTSFERARDAFARLGAEAWLARAMEDLERSQTGSATGVLTATERAVAALVADGRRNKEIGGELFMATATVEAHLTRIYRKLAIRSRAELTRLVTDGSLALDVSR